jgi:riboflavin kinase/FMN adenylyltransferase
MTIATLNWKEQPPRDWKGGALAIGNFDGVHRGHQALLAELGRQAQQHGGPAVAVTFDPPPVQLLRPPPFQPLLSLPQDRAQLMCAHGADHVLILKTTPGLLQVPAEEFFHQFVRLDLAAKAMVEGSNFGFGRNREGNIGTLQRLCDDTRIGLVVVPPEEWGGAIVSSSRVRAVLRQGDVSGAAELLVRPYGIRGRVGRGQQRGHTLGFPTANLQGVETLTPGEGVYAVRVRHDERAWAGAANIGPNPTFGESEQKIEVHIIGFSGNLLGEILEIEFIQRLRDTRPFPDVGQLVEQLRRDVDQARQLITVPQ